MKEKPSDELVSLERHGLLSVIVCIIPPEEGNIAVLKGKDAVIADGDPVGISAQIFKNSLGASEGRFAIDNPLFVVEMPPEGFKGSRFFEMDDTAGEYKITRHETFFEKSKKLSFE
jgi:hypothetical protein